MRLNLHRDRFWEIARFYQAAILNTAFGFSAYALLVWLGLNIYAAQAIAHVMGMMFNYITYSRHVFRHGGGGVRLRFILSYAVNYLASVLVLAVVAHFVVSPYIAGIMTALIVSVGNYFVLRHLVFRARAA